MPKSGPKRLGKYEVLEVVGHGGMGVVYKAIDPEIGRLVGIKMMTTKVISDPTHLKRFYREAQSAGKLRHPNIVTIYDLGVQDATPYLVMEFLEGESLDALIRSGRAISLEDKLNMVIQVCNALAYAHEQDIVHRDIKPANVMVLKDGTVKIVDFGIARIGKEHVTRTGQLLGSIQYMSPEQIQDSAVDLRTDIFSTGVLLYQLLTYQLPFEGKDAGETLLKIIHDAPPPLSKFLPAYSPELDDIAERALAKNPDERYQTASDLAFDLSHVQERLKRERVSEYLGSVELSVAEGQWVKAKEQLVQLLKIDRQNVRASDLLREVQQQIQKQERSERIRDLQSQAEYAIARDEFSEALRYLDSAVGLDENNAQLRELRDSIREKKKRTDQMSELLARAKSAFDTEDLEDALATVKQALAVDSDCRDARELHEIIVKELAERTKLKQIQTLVEEARKQIASRQFTAALDFLRKAEALDPNAPGVSDFIALASTGQQQERRRKELEEVSAAIEEALNANDYPLACTKAADAMEKFPNERSLLKLKEIAEKERESTAKRVYVESQISAARRLLEEKKAAEALIPLEQALARYPNEFVLQSMHSLITETVERDNLEQFKAQIIQQAKDAIRRKAYGEAIEVLEVAQRQNPASEFDDLLQFAHEEAASFEARNKIDAAAKEAHRLMSGDDYEAAIEVLEAILKDVDDDELRIILSDARRHLEEFNAGLQEVLSTARRLVHTERHGEAAKFLEAQAQRYGKSAEISQLLEQVNQERRRLQAFSTVKEQTRDALASSDFEIARALLEKHRTEFGDSLDAQLLQREIETKQSDAARAAVRQALQDCRVLLIVRCYQSALDILDRVSEAAAFVPDLKQEYDFARANTMAAVERERLSKERYELVKQRVAEAADQATLSNSQWVTAPSLTPVSGPGQETELANVAQLENVLGEVTLIAEHYPGDRKIQSAVGDARHRLTLQIAALRQGDFAAGAERVDHAAKTEGVARQALSAPDSATLPTPAVTDGEAWRAWPGADKLTALAPAPGLEPTMLATSGAAVSPAAPLRSELPLPGIPGERLKLRSAAQKCLADAQQAFAKSEWDQGSELLKRVNEIANHDEAIREQAMSVILAASESVLQTRRESAEPLLRLAAELYPESPLLAVLKGKIENRKRERIIEQCVTEAEAAQSSGNLEAGLAEVELGLAAYPNAPELLGLRQSIESQIREEQRRRQEEEDRESARQHGPGPTEHNQVQAELKAVEQHDPTEANSTRTLVENDPFRNETGSFSLEEPAIVTLPSQTVAPPITPDRDEKTKPPTSVTLFPLSSPLALWAGVLLLAIVGYFSWKITRAIAPSTVSVRIDTSPPGALLEDRGTGQKCITPHCAFTLTPGQHTVEAKLSGYETVTRIVSVNARGPNVILIPMRSFPTAVTGEPPAPEKPAHLSIRGAPAGARVYRDGMRIGRISREGTFSADMPAGDHQITVSAGRRDAPIIFRHFPAGGIVELHKADVQFPSPPTNTRPAPTPEELEWQKVRSTTSLADIEGFLQRYPTGIFRFEAAEKQEDLYWAKATEHLSITSLRDYLHRYPAGRYADSAQREIAKIDFEAVQNSTDITALETFLKIYSSGNYHDQVRRRLDDLSWERTGRGKDLKSVLAYLERFPNGSHVEEAQNAKLQLTHVERDPEPVTRRSAPELPPTDERKAVLQVLELYRKAYDDRNLQDLKKIWPGMTRQQLRSLSDFFRTATSVNLTYSVFGEPEVTGDEAVVKLTQSLSYIVGGKSERPKPATMIVKLRKPGVAQQGTAWQIDSIR